MSVLDRVHEGYVHGRRTAALAQALAALLPDGARVLDVGCGDGLVARRVMERRADVSIVGVDVLARPRASIPVTIFDGRSLPFGDGAFDAAMLVDVLHHAEDPEALLREAARVSRGPVVIKDHTRDGFLAGATLRFMDGVGNARHGVAIRADYWPEARWREAFARLGLRVVSWNADVPLYPWWASWAFGRRLHFIALVDATRGDRH